MRLILLRTALSVLVTAGCAREVGEIAYQEVQGEITVGEVSLSYALLVPGVATGGNGRPLIVALHYSGDQSPTVGRDFLALLVRPALRELGALMVAPQCPRGRSWVSPEVDSAVVALIDTLDALYRVDPGRVVVTGYSMGATGAWHMAAHHPNTVSASLPISGPPDPRDVALLHDVPMLVIHSDADRTFPLAMIQETINLLQFRAVPVTLHIVHGLEHGDINGFVRPLADAMPWIRAVWCEPPVWYPTPSPLAPVLSAGRRDG